MAVAVRSSYQRGLRRTADFRIFQSGHAVGGNSIPEASFIRHYGGTCRVIGYKDIHAPWKANRMRGRRRRFRGALTAMPVVITITARKIHDSRGMNGSSKSAIRAGSTA